MNSYIAAFIVLSSLLLIKTSLAVINSPSRLRPPTRPALEKKKKNKKPKNKNKKGKKKPDPDADACGSDENIHQLKMYWEEGFNWDQERNDLTEKAWCAECANKCKKEGEEVLMRECNNKKNKQFWIFSGCKVRSFANPKVCITAGENRKSDGTITGKIGLYACGDDKEQDFRTFGTDVSSKFQFETLEKEDNADLCLTTEGRPEDAEALRFMTCEKAKNDGDDLTNFWVVGVFGGHTGARKVGISKNIKGKKGNSKKKNKGGKK